MRKLLRQSGSELWLSEHGGLTPDESKAVNVEGIVHAMALCQKHNLRNTEIVLRVGPKEYDLVFKLRDIIAKPDTDVLRSEHEMVQDRHKKAALASGFAVRWNARIRNNPPTNP